MGEVGGERSKERIRSTIEEYRSVIQMTEPKGKSQCTTRTNASESSSVMSKRKTVEEIRMIMKNLVLDRVQRHFIEKAEEIKSFVVCDGVSVDVFNRYFADDEDFLIALRFVELSDDGRILIIDFPTPAHESTVDEFKSKFLRAFGDEDEVGKRGSTTVRRGGDPNKEADASFGPLRDTSERSSPPRLNNGRYRAIKEWITLAVEVARSQSWASLRRAALWWHQYTGIEYVLLIQVSEDARTMSYRLYDVGNNPLQGNDLPDQVDTGTFQHQRNGAPVNLTFDNRRILAIPGTNELPDDVNDETVVNLRAVMRQVIRTL